MQLNVDKDILIEEMWYYQWTKLFNPLTDELLRTKELRLMKAKKLYIYQKLS
ncbi:hypothetical protein [Lysinibacillus sphaericus]|uniref:hypothetical protein n=1 Tax=Lysinibacillus sphaericus TaxID=1421 RepID=UPI00194172A4|nr:hypothetical protein [Lysinibacillus sphaericus]QPA60612.1 hypothetical protein INQ55_09900 [Lysinibacillus sphaericus]